MLNSLQDFYEVHNKCFNIFASNKEKFSEKYREIILFQKFDERYIIRLKVLST